MMNTNIGGNLFNTTKFFLQTITQSETLEMTTAHILRGNLLQIKNVSQGLMNGEKETKSHVMNILMSDREYKMLEHFGTQRKWFKQYWNLLHFDGHALTGEVPINEEKQIREDISRHLEEVKMMTCNEIEAKDDSKMLIQEIQGKYPNVYLFLKEKIVEVISDNYEDALLQPLLK